MVRAELRAEGPRGIMRASVAEADARASDGERDGDRLPDPGTRPGDDGAQTVEREPSGLRVQWRVAGRRYPSAPPANGCRAAGVSASTLSVLGSPPRARAMEVFTAS